MPESKTETVADRAQGLHADTRPTLDGGVELLPDDLLKGAGNLADVNQDGQPDGLRMVAAPAATGRNLYAGAAADATTKQNTVPFPVTQPSELVNYGLVAGDPAPGPEDLAAKVPRPEKPVVRLESAGSGGFPASTPQSPHWFAFSYSIFDQNNMERHTALGPAVSAVGGQGQSYRITLPQNTPAGVEYVNIWMSEPGTSTADAVGRMRAQIGLSTREYSAPTYDLTGPYRYDPRRPGSNIALPVPRAPTLTRTGRIDRALRAGVYAAKITWTNPRGESAASPQSAVFTVDEDQRWGDNSGAGIGYVTLARPAYPLDATGWYAYLSIDNQWYKVYDRRTDAGNSRPLPLSTGQLVTTAWQSSDDFGRNNDIVVTSASPPEADTSALDPPDSAPESPVVFGAARLTPGTWFFRVTEEVEGLESLPSEPTSVTVGSEQIPRVEFPNPKNRIPNATLIEKDAAGLPLSYAITQAGGTGVVEGGEVVLATSGAQTGATPDAQTAAIPVSGDDEWSFAFRLKMANPASGALAGQVQAVLRELDPAGSATDTVLATLSGPGERSLSAKLLPPGSTGTYVRASSTVSVRLLYRFSGATKNAVLRFSRQVLKGYGWGFRRREAAAGAAADPNPAPETAMPPGADVAIEPAPAVPLPPEGETVPSPDRPPSSGTVMESPTFETGLPGGWAQNTSGGATLAVDATAALAGSLGLRSQKAGTGAAGRADLSKTFSAPTGLAARHSIGAATKAKVQSLAAGAFVDLSALTRADGQPFAWTRYANAVERAQLTIDSSPTRPGNVQVALDGAVTNIAVVAVQEVATLTLGAAPTTPGTVTVSLGGVGYPILAGGTREEFELRFTTSPSTTGTVTLTLDGASEPRYKYMFRGETPSQCAQRIRLDTWPGWTTSGTGPTVRFTAQLPGPRVDPAFDPRSTGVGAAISMLAQGAPEDADGLARRIRDYPFPGWTTAGATNAVTFTSVQAGPRTDASYDPGNTGATGTMTTTTQGTQDSPSDLAARIRGTTFAGYATGGSANVVTLTATAAGNKQDAAYYPQTTGAAGRMETLAQGAAGDLFAYARDANGTEYRRKILAGVAASVFNVDVAASGADVHDARGDPITRAAVNFFGSTATNPKTLLARFEDLDLTGYPAAGVRIGVTGDSGSAATWDVYTDDAAATDLGQTHYNDHDYSGKVLNQAYWHGPKGQPPSDEFFWQDLEWVAMPGEQQTLSARARWDGVPASSPAFPLYVVAVTPGGRIEPVRDVLSASGISGTSGWTEVSTTVTVPDSGDPDENFYRLKLYSRNVGEGEMVIQQVAASLGTGVKRTPLYATAGTYRATLRVGAPTKPPFLGWGRRRSALLVDYEVPVGTTLTAVYRAGDSQDGPWDAWQADPTLPADKEWLQAEISGTGDGVATWLLKSGFPIAHYDVVLGRRPVSVFLKGDGSELPGGADFEVLRDHSDPSQAILHEKPGGDFDVTALYPPLRQVPAFTLQVYTPEAARYVEERWQAERFRMVDALAGLDFEVKLRPPERFEKVAPRFSANGQLYAHYKAKVPGAVVTVTRALP